MKNKKLDLYNKLEELEKKKIAYLEVNQKSSVSRIQKQIDNIELQIELYELNKIKRELSVYKKVITNYPELLNRVKRELSDDY